MPRPVAVGAQQLGRRCVAEDVRLDLLEDPVGGERAEHAPDGANVRVAGKVSDPPRPLGKGVRHSQLGDDAEGLRCHGATLERPEQCLGGSELIPARR